MSSANLDAVQGYQAVSTKRRANVAASEPIRPSRNPLALGINRYPVQMPDDEEDGWHQLRLPIEINYAKLAMANKLTSRSATAGNSPGQGQKSSANLDAVRGYQAVSTKRRANGTASEETQPSRNP